MTSKQGLIKKFIDKLAKPQEEELEIPESWKNSEVEEAVEPVSTLNPIAVDPLIVFRDESKNGLRTITPLWYMKLKRVTAFLLFLGCIISIINLVTSFPAGLFFVVPTMIINLDYLMKTQPKTTKYAMHILDNVEELKK